MFVLHMQGTAVTPCIMYSQRTEIPSQCNANAEFHSTNTLTVTTHVDGESIDENKP